MLIIFGGFMVSCWSFYPASVFKSFSFRVRFSSLLEPRLTEAVSSCPPAADAKASPLITGVKTAIPAKLGSETVLSKMRPPTLKRHRDKWPEDRGKVLL